MRHLSFHLFLVSFQKLLQISTVTQRVQINYDKKLAPTGAYALAGAITFDIEICF